MTDTLDRNNYVMVQVLRDENHTLKVRVAELERRLAEQVRSTPRRSDPEWQGPILSARARQAWAGEIGVQDDWTRMQPLHIAAGYARPDDHVGGRLEHERAA